MRLLIILSILFIQLLILDDIKEAKNIDLKEDFADNTICEVMFDCISRHFNNVIFQIEFVLLKCLCNKILQLIEIEE